MKHIRAAPCSKELNTKDLLDLSHISSIFAGNFPYSLRELSLRPEAISLEQEFCLKAAESRKLDTCTRQSGCEKKNRLAGAPPPIILFKWNRRKEGCNGGLHTCQARSKSSISSSSIGCASTVSRTGTRSVQSLPASEKAQGNGAIVWAPGRITTDI